MGQCNLYFFSFVDGMPACVPLDSDGIRFLSFAHGSGNAVARLVSCSGAPFGSLRIPFERTCRTEELAVRVGRRSSQSVIGQCARPRGQRARPGSSEEPVYVRTD